MGQTTSHNVHAANDFELTIRSSKELEYILDVEFHASGKGLHEKISSVSSQLNPNLVRSMRYLATIRNKLVHEHGFDAIPDRNKFIQSFEKSNDELNAILRKRKSTVGKARGSKSTCIIS